MVRGALHQSLWRLMGYYGFRKLLGGTWRVRCWRALGCSVPSDVIISAGVNMRMPQRVSIGSGSALVGKNIEIDSWGHVTIGRNVLINGDVSLYTADHPVDSPDFGDAIRSIRIGDYVWMPNHIIVLPGVTIGNYAVVGTGSVVSRDIPDYSVAVGNPARVVKQRARIAYTYIPALFHQRPVRRAVARRLPRPASLGLGNGSGGGA